MSSERNRRLCVLGALLITAVLVPAGRAAAQAAAEGRRIYDEQLRVRLDQQQAMAREMGLDAGGWFTFAFFNFDDASARHHRTLRQYELRLWASYTLEGVHKFYFRGKGGYDDWNSGDNPDGHGDDCQDGEVERAWYHYDYNRHVRNRTGQDPQVGFELHLGRDYYTIGSGLALALPLDAVDITGNFGDWTVRGLLGKTLRDTQNIDDSDPVSDHMERCFYGVEVKYTGFDRHEPYAYFLWQIDETDEQPSDPDQGYSYDSRYLGVGSAGSILVPDLRYAAELVFETGRSHADGVAGEREKIHAMALDVMVEYLFDVPRHPKVHFEYLWGSGDSDRLVSSSSTLGGNRAGTRDEAFNAFGFRDTGLAFAPRIGNLHIFQLGASAFPLEDVKPFRKMELGTTVYFYTKDASSGGISDPTGSVDASWVGWEWDLYLNWRLTSDVSLTTRYGAFWPGSAFESRDCRQFLFAGVTYSF